MSEQVSQPREIDWDKIIETALDMPGSVGNVYSRFYNYSYANQAYLWMQGARVPVATYKRWQALGRQVLRASKAYEIIQPIFAKKNKNYPDAEPIIVRLAEAKLIF